LTGVTAPFGDPVDVVGGTINERFSVLASEIGVVPWLKPEVVLEFGGGQVSELVDSHFPAGRTIVVGIDEFQVGLEGVVAIEHLLGGVLLVKVLHKGEESLLSSILNQRSRSSNTKNDRLHLK